MLDANEKLAIVWILVKRDLKLYSLSAALFLTFLSANAQVTHYVDIDSTNPVAPYTDWSTAATDIQEAVDSASAGDLVLVTNGVYSGGGRVVLSPITNCVVVTNAITVQSMNGPSTTVIQAYPMPDMTNGSSRCVYLGSRSVLSGFTLMNGSVTNGSSGGGSGGGIYCNSGNCVVSNCLIVGNWAQGGGGGGFGGTYYECVISNNGAAAGGGVSLGYGSAMADCLINSNNASGSGGGIYCSPSYNDVISNCVITSNYSAAVSTGGGGGYDGSYYNCIISGNSCAWYGGGLYLTYSSPPGGVVDNCLIVNNLSGYQGGGVYSYELNMINCTVAKNSSYNSGGGVYVYYLPGSLTNCIVYYNSLQNIGGQGADLVGTINLCNCCATSAGVNGVSAAPGFVNVDGGDFQLAAWSPCIDAGTNVAMTGSVDLAGNPRVVNGTVDIGAYEYQDEFTNLVHFVALNNTNATPPFTNWMTAASNIQAAIDLSSPSDFIVVSNGTYGTGGRAVYGTITNRIVLDVPITVQSLSGEGFTFIQGSTKYGIRCAYLTNGATLMGFTLTNGDAYSSIDPLTNENGGGALCESTTAAIINCIFGGDIADNCGGGAYSGTLVDCVIGDSYAGSGGGACASTLINCVLTNNLADHGAGACLGILTNCLLINNTTFAGSGNTGGGACSNTLYNCMVISNWSDFYGGGAYACVASNSTFIGNSTAINGGGAYASTLASCTLIGNAATNSGGGAYSNTLSSCILTGNRAANGGAAAYGVLLNCTLTNNTASDGGGAFFATLTNCVLLANIAANGGGEFGGTLNDCLVSSNSAAAYGGGACFGTMSGCAISNNTALYGGGVASNTLYNCTVAWNNATNSGGGSFGGTLDNCLIFTNTAVSISSRSGGGSCSSILNSCDLIDNAVVNKAGLDGGGGGSYGGVLTDCILSNNVSSGSTFSPTAYGGGAANAILTNCLVVKNRVTGSGQGGGAYDCSLDNCTIAFNVGLSAGIVGAGATNCIIYYNVGVNSNWVNGATFAYCCTTPLPTGLNVGNGNFTNAPLFLSTNDFHLQSDSPCINSGNNSFVAVATDLDGNPRIAGGTVDMGAYEYQTPTSVISYAYLQQYGLPTDGSVDSADLDGTGFEVYQDWVAGLNPTNPASILAMFQPVATTNASGVSVSVSWQSVSGILYNLERSTNLAAQPDFLIIQTNIPGHAVTTSYTDSTATNSVPYFYRVSVTAE